MDCTERVPFLERCGLFSGGIAICAYAQTVDELRRDPFEMGVKTRFHEAPWKSQFCVVEASFWSSKLQSPNGFLCDSSTESTKS